MRYLHKRSLAVSLALCLAGAIAGSANAQLVPLTGISDGDQLRRINGVFKELSSSGSGQAGRLIPSLLDSLTNLDQNAWNQVYQQLHVIMSDPSVIDALVQALKTNNAEAASGILANCKQQGAFISGRFIGRHYNGSNGSYDLSAAQVKDIIFALASDNGNVRRNLATVLAGVSLPNDTSVQESLIRLLSSDTQSMVRVAAANSLGSIGREIYFKNAVPIATAFGKALIEDPSPQVRGEAANGLAQMSAKAEPAAAALSKALTDNSSQVRFQVLQSIINIGPACADCLPELIDMFNGPADAYHGVGKDRIVQAFGALGPAAAKAVPLITPLLNDRSTMQSAARALASIGPAASPAIPELIKAMDSPFANDRVTAIQALAAIGPKAKAALSALHKACNDDRNAEGFGNADHVKQAAKEAIIKISGGLDS